MVKLCGDEIRGLHRLLLRHIGEGRSHGGLHRNGNSESLVSDGEVSSTDFTIMPLPPRRASSVSTYHSGEDIATTLASSEVDERPDLGMLASPLFTQTRQASAASSRLSLLQRKVLCQFHHTFQPIQGNLWRSKFTGVLAWRFSRSS